MGKLYKILVHCPISIRNNICYDSIINIDPIGHSVDFLFNMSNKYDPQYNKGIEQNPLWGHNVADKMNRAKKMVLDNGYDFMLNIEHDMIIPKDILRMVSMCGEYECVTGLYRARKNRNKNTPLCLKTINKEWPLYEDIKDKERVGLWIIPFGCILIPNKVLKDITFDAGIDGSFAGRTDTLGIKKYVIPSIICDHVDRDGVVYKVMEE